MPHRRFVPTTPLFVVMAACSSDPVDGRGIDGGSTAAEQTSSDSGPDTETTADDPTTSSAASSSGPEVVGSSSEGGSQSETTSATHEPPQCGDGVVQGDEECDDGNAVPNDGCEATCIVSGVAQVSVGRTHVCVLTRAQTIRCFGQSTRGELGYGNVEAIGDDEEPHVAGDVLLGDVLPVFVGAGLRHSCALLEDGSVKCWGDAQSGRLGYATAQNIGDDEVPADVGAVDVGGTVVKLSVGDQHNCAVLEDGAVRCWGLNFQGAVLGYGGVGNIGDDEVPAEAGDVPFGDTSIEQVSAGFTHSCAVSIAGEVFCWGVGEFGKLGTGSLEPVPIPLDAPAELGGDARQVLAGSVTSCALMADDDLQCWGRGAFYALGNQMTEDIGDDEPPSSAGEVPLGFNVQQVVGEGYHLCALSEAGTVSCWGSPLHGRIGSGSAQIVGDDELPSDAPSVTIGGPALSLSADIESTCAVRDDHQLVCWGRNDDGRIGIPGGQDVGDDESPLETGLVEIFGR